MKSWLPAFFVVSTLCLFPAAGSIAASDSSTGPKTTKDSKMGTPLAEMMLYEAAEQAVEDGYAEIIPEPESKTPQEAADTNSEQTGQATAPSDTEAQNKEK